MVYGLSKTFDDSMFILKEKQKNGTILPLKENMSPITYAKEPMNLGIFFLLVQNCLREIEYVLLLHCA